MVGAKIQQWVGGLGSHMVEKDLNLWIWSGKDTVIADGALM